MMLLKNGELDTNLLINFHFLEAVQQKKIALIVKKALVDSDTKVPSPQEQELILERLLRRLQRPMVPVNVLVTQWKLREMSCTTRYLGKVLLEKAVDASIGTVCAIFGASMHEQLLIDDLWDKNEFPPFPHEATSLQLLRKFAIYWKWIAIRTVQEGFVMAFPTTFDPEVSFLDNVSKVFFGSLSRICIHKKDYHGKNECSECKREIIALRKVILEFFGRFEGHFRAQLSNKKNKKLNLKALNKSIEFAKRSFGAFTLESHVKLFDIFFEFCEKKFTNDIVEERDYLHWLYGDHAECFAPGVSYAKKHD